MSSSCSCGAITPVDARFCPRCGRPLGAVPDNEAEVLLPVPPANTSADPSSIGFGSSQVLRSTLLASVVAVVLSNLLGTLFFIWYPGAGFLSVYTYRRRTGLTPTGPDGAKLGLLTGIFTYVITLATLVLVFLMPREDGNFVEAIRREIITYPAQEEFKQQMLELLHDPSALAVLLLIYLVIFFLLVVGLMVTGGVIGTKILNED